MTSTILTKVKSVTPAGWINLTMLAIFTILLGIFLMGMPKYMDDYSFLLQLSDWYYENGVADPTEGVNVFKAGLPFDSISQMWSEHWSTDSDRLANLIGSFMLIFPKWFGSLFPWIAWMFVMYFSFKIAGVKINQTLPISLAIVFWGIFLPWPSHMGALMYQYNYIIPTAFSLYVIYLATSNKKSNYFNNYLNRHYWIKNLLYCLLGLFTGLWHEAFTATLIMIIFVLFLYLREWKKWDLYFLIIGLVIGLIFLIFTPGTGSRIEDKEIKGDYQLYKIIAYNLLYYLFVTILIIRKLTKKERFILSDKIIIICIFGGFTPILISLLTYTYARITWMTQILSIIGIIHILKLSMNNKTRIYYKVNLIFSILLLIGVNLRFVIIDIDVFKIRNMMAENIYRYIRDPNKSVFGNVITGANFSFISYKMPDIIISSYYAMNAHFFRNWSGKTDFAIIPEELKFASVLNGKQIKGDVPIYELGGRYFLSGNEVGYFHHQLVELEIDYSGTIKKVRGYVYRFISEADGQEYVYLAIIDPWYEGHFKQIQSINFVN